MTIAHIGTSNAYLRLSSNDSDAGPPKGLVAELRLDTLAATRTVGNHYASGFVDLAEFFMAMEEAWRGWDGARRWRSFEDELSIEAQHDGHIRLIIVLRNVYPWTWTATAHLRLDPGEQLSSAAAAIQTLASGS